MTSKGPINYRQQILGAQCQWEANSIILFQLRDRRLHSGPWQLALARVICCDGSKTVTRSDWQIFASIAIDWQILTNIGKYLQMLPYLGKCWQILTNIGKYWQILENIAIYLQILANPFWLKNCDTDQMTTPEWLEWRWLWVTLGVISWESATFSEYWEMFISHFAPRYGNVKEVIWSILSPAVQMEFRWKSYAWEN